MIFLNRHRLLAARPAALFGFQVGPKKETSMRYSRSRPLSAGARIQPPPRRAVFAYLGGESRIVIGPATGVVYKFRGPGACLKMDPRDAAALQKLAAMQR